MVSPLALKAALGDDNPGSIAAVMVINTLNYISQYIINPSNLGTHEWSTLTNV